MKARAPKNAGRGVARRLIAAPEKAGSIFNDEGHS
jgi:hypothetical protein